MAGGDCQEEEKGDQGVRTPRGQTGKEKNFGISVLNRPNRTGRRAVGSDKTSFGTNEIDKRRKRGEGVEEKICPFRGAVPTALAEGGKRGTYR